MIVIEPLTDRRYIKGTACLNALRHMQPVPITRTPRSHDDAGALAGRCERALAVVRLGWGLSMRLAAPDQAGRKARNLPLLSTIRRGHRSRRIIIRIKIK